MKENYLIVVVILSIFIGSLTVFFVVSSELDKIPSFEYRDYSHVSKEFCISSVSLNWNEMENVCECDDECQEKLDRKRLDYTPANPFN